MSVTTDRAVAASPADPRRYLGLPGTFNLRDLGGYPVRGGGITRWRTLLRSDALHRLTDPARAALAQLGLRHVVDLRSADEIGRAPDALGRLPVTTTGTPVFTRVPGGGAGPTSTSLDEVYRYMVDHCGAGLTAAVVALGGPAGTPALVHCSAGKDRTGLLVALVLDLVGVDEEHIAADYALTANYIHAQSGGALRQLSEGTGSDHATDPALLACPPELILAALRQVRERHGGTREFLLHHGATEPALARLGEALVAPAPPEYPHPSNSSGGSDADA